MVFFTADEHYGHPKIIKYCDRPFTNVKQMNKALIENHNDLVKDRDYVYHLGDFCYHKLENVKSIIKKLKGRHVFLKGSHDNWLGSKAVTRIEGVIRDGILVPWSWRPGEIYIVLDHYAMLRWPRSHYNSWQIFGHSHGKLQCSAKQWDIGVDNNMYAPVSWERLKQIMSRQPNNPNYIDEDFNKEMRVV